MNILSAINPFFSPSRFRENPIIIPILKLLQLIFLKYLTNLLLLLLLFEFVIGTLSIYSFMVEWIVVNPFSRSDLTF